jgi:hypothetical protein
MHSLTYCISIISSFITKFPYSIPYQVLKNDEFVPLDMESTLSQNGVEDESEKFLRLGLPEDFFITTLHVYFNDDLTYA